MIALKTIDKDLNYLRQVSEEIEKSDKKINEYISLLKDYCQDKELFAISGIQLGIPKRIIYIKKSKNNKELVMINPTVTNQKGNTYFWESCLSCLDNVCLVCRPYEIKATYYDEYFNKKEEVFKGFISTIISHEIDHLNGKLMIDITEEIKKLSKDKRNELREKEPYKIIKQSNQYDKNRILMNDDNVMTLNGINLGIRKIEFDNSDLRIIDKSGKYCLKVCVQYNWQELNNLKIGEKKNIDFNEYVLTENNEPAIVWPTECLVGKKDKTSLYFYLNFENLSKSIHYMNRRNQFDITPENMKIKVYVNVEGENY